MQKEDDSIYLTTLIILETLLDLFSWKLSVDQHFASLVSQTAIDCLLLLEQKYP